MNPHKTVFSDGTRRASGATLKLLDDTVSSIEPGRGALIMITGPHGSGKTELVDEVIQTMAGWSALRVAALSWRAHTPRAVVDFILERAGSTHDSLLDAFDHVGSSVVLVVDDAHWADERSLQLLVEATRSIRHARFVVVLTSLDTEDGVGEPTMSQLREISDIDLGIPPYTVDEVRAFALAHVGAHLSPAAAAELRALTGGRPVRIREVLDASPVDIWRSQNPQVPIPAPWHAALQRRLTGYDADAVMRVLKAAAITPGGRESQAELVLELSGADREVLLAAFNAGLLETRHIDSNQLVGFRNPTDRAAVRSRTSPTESAELHRRAAKFYRRYGEDGRSLIHEGLGVEGSDDDISNALNQRANHLAEEGHWRSAAEAYGLASSTASDPEVSLKRHLSRVEAHIASSDIPLAHQHAGSVSHISGNPQVYSMRGYLALHEGRRSEAVGLINLAWRHLDETQNTEPALRTNVASRQVLLSLSEWQPERLVTWADTTARWAPPASPESIEAQYIAMIGKAATTGHIQPSVPISGETPILALRRHMASGWLSLVHDDPITARQSLSRSVETEGGEGSERIHLWMDGWLARTLFVLGELPEALRVVERGLARAERYGIKFLEPLLLWTGSQIAAFKGDKDLARDYTSRLTISQDSFLIQRIPSYMSRMLLGSFENDQPAMLRAGRTLTKLSEDFDIGHPGFWPWEDVWAQSLVSAGDVAEADRITTVAEDRAQGSGILSVQAKLAVPRAGVLIQHGDVDQGLARFEEGIEMIETLPAPFYQSRILYEYGRALRRLGRRRRADEAFARAGEVFAAMGAWEFVERCNRERRAGGLGTRTPRAGGLTPQEEEIAKLVATGATNREVAAELYLSSKTVEYHLTRVYRKLGVRTRNELPTALAEL